MMPSTEQLDKTTRNQQATASLVLGMASVSLALFDFAPGLISALSCVGATAALLAFTAGTLGLRATRPLGERGRQRAIIGISAGGGGLLLFLASLVPGFSSAQEKIKVAAKPQTFQGDGFTLTYPADWSAIDIGQQDWCKQPGVECLLAIGHPSHDGTNLNLIHTTLLREASIKEVDQLVWAEAEATTPGLTLHSREDIEIDGLPAIRRIFDTPSPSTPDGRAHVLQIHVVDASALLTLTIWTPNADVLAEHRAEVEDIINNLQFIP